MDRERLLESVITAYTNHFPLMNVLTARLYQFAMLALLSGALTACGQQQLPQGVVYCSEGNPETFNPQTVTSGTTIDATSRQIYSRLVDYDADAGTIIPALASRWEISDDGLEYRFFLRQGVKFHHSANFTPSRELNAEDVLFSFQRILNDQDPYHGVSPTGYPFFQSIEFQQLVASVSKNSDYEVIFRLNRRDASFLSNLATDFAVILSAEYAQQQLNAGTPERLDAQAIGTGPFRLVEYVKNDYIRYRRNDDYWGKKPEIEMLVYDITPKSTVRLSKLITGDCSVSSLPKAGELTLIEEHPDLTLDSRPGLNVAFWAFNTQKPPLNDVRVRQALSLAIDKRNILSAVYQNTAIEAQGLLPPTSWAYDSEYQPDQHYSPQKAKRLLAEAGVSKLTIDIWAMPVARAYNPNALKTAELIQADLANIGVKANIISYDWSVFTNNLNRSNYDSVLIGWNADNSDPDNFFSPLLSCASVLSGSNRSRWCDPAFDMLLGQARASIDPQQRKALYRQAQTRASQEYPLFAFAHAKRSLVYRNNIAHMPVNAFGGLSFADLSLAEQTSVNEVLDEGKD